MRKLFKLGCVVLFAVLVIEPSHASVADAQRLYAAGKYSEAWKEFDRYAKVGDPASQYAVASMYYNGQGVEKNLLLAFAWWTLAAEQKYKDAAGLSKMAQKKMTPEELASLEEKFSDLYALYGGDSLMETIYPAIIPENLTKKIVFSTEYQNIEGLQYQEDAELEASAESSDEDAFVKMLEHKSTAPNVRTSAYMLQADFTIAPDGSVRDYEPVFRYGRTEYAAAKVRELKFKPATFDGKPVFVDVRKGFGLLDADAPILSKINLHENYHHLYRALTNSKNLSQKESPMGNYLYACSLMLFEGVSTDREKIDSLLLSAAEAGIDEAQYVLGLRWYRSQTNIEKGIYWISAAAKQGLTNAELRLGKILQESPWVKPDEMKATFWFNRAAKQGDINALRKMAWVRLFSKNQELLDANLALKHLEPLKTADEQNPEVHYLLAWAYYKSVQGAQNSQHSQDSRSSQISQGSNSSPSTQGSQKALAIATLEKAIGMGKAKRWDVKEWEDDLVSWKSRGTVIIEEVPQSSLEQSKKEVPAKTDKK